MKCVTADSSELLHERTTQFHFKSNDILGSTVSNQSNMAGNSFKLISYKEINKKVEGN